MIEEKSWELVRDALRNLRLEGKQIKFIGRKSQHPTYVTGVPVHGGKIYVTDGILLPKDFINRVHLLSSFSVDGVNMSNLIQ